MMICYFWQVCSIAILLQLCQVDSHRIKLDSRRVLDPKTILGDDVGVRTNIVGRTDSGQGGNVSNEGEKLALAQVGQETNTTLKDVFYITLMFSSAILDKLWRRELPFILKATQLDEHLLLNRDSTFQASSAEGGGVRLLMTNIAVQYNVLSLPTASVMVEFAIAEQGQTISISNIEILPAPNASVQRFLHRMVAPLQRLMLRSVVRIVEANWADVFRTVACFDGEYEVTIPSVQADRQGNVGVGLAFSRVGKRRPTRAPMPLKIFEQHGRREHSRLAVFWSRGMIEAMSGSRVLEKAATSWIKGHHLPASWTGRTNAAFVNTLLKTLGVAENPHLERLKNKFYNVKSGDVEGILDVLDASNKGVSVLDALFTKDEFGELVKIEPPPKLPFHKGSCRQAHAYGFDFVCPRETKETLADISSSGFVVARLSRKTDGHFHVRCRTGSDLSLQKASCLTSECGKGHKWCFIPNVCRAGALFHPCSRIEATGLHCA